jgi:cytochrome c oxidase assembly protein subunit 15
MNGHFIPEGIDWSRGIWALTHDPYLIHFLHRWWAWVAVAALVVMARRVKPLNRRASIAIHATIGTQVLLGIATVMSGMNIVIATLHQAVGAAVVIASAWGAHVVGRQER